MPLFTSSSNHTKTATKAWLMTWILVVFICTAVLFSYEMSLKHKGFMASIENNNDLWSWYRAQVHNNPNSLVIIGASRSQLDINIPYLKQMLPHYDVTQLSVNGHYPMATLKALAQDERFNGTVIMSLNAEALEPIYFDMQLSQNQYYAEKSSVYKSMDAYLSAFLRSQFRFLHPLLSLQQIIEFYEKNHSFKPAFYTTAHLDQSISGYYELTDSENLYQHFVREKAKYRKDLVVNDVEEWAKNIPSLRHYAQLIKNRGGRLIIVRFPTFKGLWELDEEYYPRHLYWNKIAAQTDLTTLHFKDIVALNDFQSPDGSHLDQKDSKNFTQILFGELIKLNYLNPIKSD